LEYLKCEPCAKWTKWTHAMASSIKISQYIVRLPTSHDDPELVNIVKTTRWDEFLVAVPQMFDTVKSVALWSAKKKDHKGLRFRS
jgi:hypothetical protein